MSMMPSAYGFRNIRPKSRKERYGLKDKVALEKSRIDTRVGWEARLHQANAPATSSQLTSCTAGSAGFISNSDRFHSDTAGEEYQIRQDQLERKKQVAEFKRNNVIKRDSDRWSAMEQKAKEEDDRWQAMRESGKHGMKNQSIVAYDITNLQYHQDVAGEQQKYLDDMVRYRAALRTNQLIVKGDTRVPYNIISGDEREPIRNPNPIPKPSSYGSETKSARVADGRRTGGF
eukprot:gene16409-22374_t